MKAAGAGPTVLSRRALNRALLERQHLLRRRPASGRSEIEHLVAMQAQVPTSPYVGLWTRLVGFQTDELAELIMSRRAVRIAMHRSTIHLVTAADCLRLRPLFQPFLDQSLRTGTPFGRNVVGMDMPALIAKATRLMRAKPRTLTELGTILHEHWPDRDATSLAYTIRYLVPLVQVPPRGIWGKSGQATCTTAELWLGRRLSRKPSLESLIARYLAAFGPATVSDFQSWSGLRATRPSFERMRGTLRTFADERGRELFDVLDGELPDPSIPAPPRFLPEYDNLVLGHDDRTRVIDVDHRYSVGNPMILVDGRVAGIWSIERQRTSARLRIQSFTALRRDDRTALAEEGTRLLTFAVDTPDHDVTFEVVPARSTWQR